MKLAWVSLFFHIAMLSWLREDGMSYFKKSVECGGYSERRRLLLVVLPGLRFENGEGFRPFEGSVGRVEPHNCPAPLSYFAGVASPPVLPGLLDTVFDHVDLTVYSSRDDFIIDKSFLRVRLPVYFKRRKRSRSVFAEFDGVADFLLKQPKDTESPLGKANSTLFLVNLAGLAGSNMSSDAVERIQFDVRHLAKTMNMVYGDSRTTVLLLGDNGGPFAIWGPDIVNDPTKLSIRASDVAPLISALLGVAVPFYSIGRLPPSLISSPRQRSTAVYCNVQQLSRLVDEVTKGPTMTDLKRNCTSPLYWLKILMYFQWYDRATGAGYFISYTLSKIYHQAKMRLRQILYGVMISLITSWIYLLLSEMASISYAVNTKCTITSIVFHVVSAVFTLTAAVLPFWMQWPYSFHLYCICPFAFLWAAISKLEAVLSFLKAATWKQVPKYAAYLIGTLLLAEYSLRASHTEMLSLVVGLCVLVHYPALPRFVVSPFLAKCCWWMCCFGLLGSLYLPQWATGQPKFLNLCGTIMICLTGFSSFWVSPCRDGLLSVFITFLSTATMLIQSLARAPEFRQYLKYIAGPMMFVPFLALLGKLRTKNRLIHVTFAFGALLMLTSTRLEPLCYLLSVTSCCLWTLMENFRLSNKLGTDEIRRAMFLGIIIHSTIAVTRTLPESYIHLEAPKWIPLLDLYRHTMILTSLMSIYLTMIPSDTHTYSSYIVLLMADAIATLRAVISGLDSTQLHIHGVALAIAFHLGRLFAVQKKKPDPDDNDDNPNHLPSPPIQ